MNDQDDLAEKIGISLGSIADAITATGAPGTDEAGGTVASLTEAVMGVTAGLVRIADALNRIADAITERE